MTMYLLPYPPGPHKPGAIVSRNLVVCPTIPRGVAKRPESWNIKSLQADQTSNLEPVTLLGAEYDYLGNPMYAVTNQQMGEICTIPLDLTGLVPPTPASRHTAVGATITVGALYRGQGISIGCRLVGALNTEANNQIKFIGAGPADQHGNYSWQYVTADIVIHDALDKNDDQAGNGGVDLELIWMRPTSSTHTGFQVLAFRADYTGSVPDGIPNTEYFDALHIPPAHALDGAWRAAAYASASSAAIAAPKPAHPPGVPTALAVTGLTETALVLHWNADPADHDLHEFRVYRDGGITPVATIAAPKHDAPITGLTPHTEYRFTVTAVNNANLESAHSAVLTVSTNAVATPPKPAGGTGSGGATGGSAPAAGTPTTPPIADPIVGGDVAKPSTVYPAPLTATDVATFMGSPTDTDLIALATKQIPVVTLLARAYTRGHGFAYVDSKHTERIPNDEIRAVILAATARLCANPDQIAYRVGSVSFSDGFAGWSLAELAALNRYRPRSM